MGVRVIETDAEAIVREELDAARARIIENHIAAGQKATGATADSVVVSVTTLDTTVIGEIDARAFFAALETGTKPWANPHMRQRKDGTEYPSAPKWFIDIIRDWATAKGVDVSPWGVATKIMTDGSKLFRDGGRSDIFTPEIKTALNNIADRVAGLFEAQLIESILRESEP